MLKFLLFTGGLLFIGLCTSVAQVRDSIYILRAVPGSIHLQNQLSPIRLERCLLSDGGAYQLILQKSQFKQVYLPGDSIITPFYLPEMELLGTEKTYQVEYRFKILK